MRSNSLRKIKSEMGVMGSGRRETAVTSEKLEDMVGYLGPNQGLSYQDDIFQEQLH